MSETGRRRNGKRAGRQAGAAVAAVLAHAALLPVLFAAQGDPGSLPMAVEPTPMVVELIRPPEPPPPRTPDKPPPGPKAETPTPPGPPQPSPAPPAPRPPLRVRPAPPTPRMESVPIPAPTPAPPPDIPMPTVGEAQLAGALRAGSGAGRGGGAGGGGGSGDGAGGGCDMVRELQNALREDPDVRDAVTRAYRSAGPGRALLVWDGDWRQTPGQSGKGLAGVRQAIALEVAFAPQACRREAMRGLVLLTMSDAPGAARVALGTGSWRWSDLLGGR